MRTPCVVRSAIASISALVLAASPALAIDIPGPSVQVTANVSSTLTFNVTITELIPNGSGGTTIGPVVTAMNFATLASNGTFDPDGAGPRGQEPRSLNSLKAFQVFFGINAQQRPFTIKQSSGPLQSGGNTIANGGFIVTPLDGVGGDISVPLPSHITKGSRTSAIGNNIVLFSSTGGGPSATMAATYGITDDPMKGATAAIPLDQPAGNYVTTITYTATVL